MGITWLVPRYDEAIMMCTRKRRTCLKNKTTGSEAHLIMTGKTVSRLGLNRYTLGVPIHSLVYIPV